MQGPYIFITAYSGIILAWTLSVYLSRGFALNDAGDDLKSGDRTDFLLYAILAFILSLLALFMYIVEFRAQCPETRRVWSFFLVLAFLAQATLSSQTFYLVANYSDTNVRVEDAQAKGDYITGLYATSSITIWSYFLAFIAYILTHERKKSICD